jgi:ATP-dependent Lon protease
VHEPEGSPLSSVGRRRGGRRRRRREARDLRAWIESVPLSATAKEAALEDLHRLSVVGPAHLEHRHVTEHLRWLLELPWARPPVEPVDLPSARAVLDRDLDGLDDVKERILELLATFAASSQPRSVLCLVGPSGVGKTALARAIARAAGRPFVQASVAGVEDEEDFKGRPVNHPGAMPGILLQGLRRAGRRDAVFALDEIDRVGRDGGPFSALLEAIDPDWNAEFTDLYLDVPFDLSSVLFVTTANVVVDVPRSVRDRLEVLSLPGYMREEKVAIARRHLLPEALSRAGFAPDEVPFDDDALRAIVRDYTREAGVRGLARMLARAGRRLALLRATGQPLPSRVGPDEAHALLGPAIHAEDALPREPAIGAAAGLAWTTDGGVVQWIEVISMSGAGHIVVTGRLGDVMRESADIAYSWARANAAALGFREEDVKDLDLHVHAPEGGVRKDGPSAGVALVTAIVSVFSRRAIRPDVAMTGELTLRGRVLEVSGIREKVSAAHRAGIRHVCLPAANRKDVETLSEDVRRVMRFDFFERVTEYLDVALLPRLPK